MSHRSAPEKRPLLGSPRPSAMLSLMPSACAFALCRCCAMASFLQTSDNRFVAFSPSRFVLLWAAALISSAQATSVFPAAGNAQSHSEELSAAFCENERGESALALTGRAYRLRGASSRWLCGSGLHHR